jgi:tRNA (cmo5U34)-methyltransferase
MSAWDERDSETFRAIAEVAVPRRGEMLATLVAAVPFERGTRCRIVDLGSGDGRLSAHLLDRWPGATLLALDGSESMRAEAAARLAPFGDRARVRPFDLASVDWWDLLFGADLVVSSLCLHHLNAAKTQYLFKAVADRVSARGALLVADLVAPAHEATRRVAADAWDAAAQAQADGDPGLLAAFADSRWNWCRHPDPDDTPSALFHQLVWLKHAGFAAVDCLWMYAGHAVFAGYKSR